MKIYEDNASKIIEIWLTTDEKSDETLQCRLKALFGQWQQRKYTVAVYYSGSQSLRDVTAGLLLHNQKVFAAQAAEAARQQAAI